MYDINLLVIVFDFSSLRRGSILSLMFRFTQLLGQPSIGRRFALAILVFSSIVTLTSTILQLSIEYKQDVSEITSRLDQIRDSYNQSLASSLWVTSQENLQLQLDGIIKLPDMQYLEVVSDENKIMAIAGKPQVNQIISQTYSLMYAHRGNELLLGKLHVVATLHGVHERLKSRVLVILLTQGIKTFLVSLFILYLFQILVGKHLTRIANFSTSPTNTKLDDQLELQRKVGNHTQNDELEQLVDSINGMRKDLKSYYHDLEESEFRWKFALEGGGDGVWDWNLLNNKINYSDHYKEMLGYNKDQNWQDLDDWKNLCHPDDWTRVLTEVHDYLDAKSPLFDTEFQAQCKDGSWIWIEASGMIVSHDEAGKPLRLIGTHHDITQRKASTARENELNQQLIQATKLESIGQLTAGIAHDFNNILTAIMGYTELIQSVMSTKPEAYGKLPKYIDEVLNGCDRAKQLVQQMLIFSRRLPESTTHQLNDVQLSPLLKEVVSLLRASIPSTISLTYEVLQEDLKTRIQPVQLHQILMNLGVNARDAIGEYGDIHFSLGLSLPYQQTCSSCKKEFVGNFVQITVKDSGPGIPKTALNSVFDPFFTTKEIGKGTGMGLSVVHGIVHQANGHIIVESDPDSGTCFQIFLPLVETNETVLLPTHTTKTTSQSLSGLNLMVLDDETAISTMLKEVLEAQGATVTIFNKPLLALEAFKKAPSEFDMLITDETMPKLSGMHLSIEILEIRPDFPIILCTGYSDHATAESVRKIGIKGFMYKPLNAQNLIAQITELTQPTMRM